MDTTGIRELTMDELDNVAGGSPAAFGFVVGFLATKLLEDVAPAFKVVDQIRTMVEKGK